MSYDPADLERTWRERWASEGRYEVDPAAGAEPTFVTAPYPYPSGGMHIGHARTYTVPDVYARYRRQQGDQVLFPLAWHVTGTPIIGAVERLRNGDEDQIDSLQRAFGVPEEDLASLETPMGYARYFIEDGDASYKTGMQELGLSIDWRREFTTNDERYSRFIAWQYETLRERGLLERGLHPVKYCTRQENPVTTHDLLEGEEVDFQEYALVKFRGSDGAILPMATLRPETVRGVTNAFIDPAGTYVEADIDGETWIVSEEAIEKLSLQDRETSIEATHEGARFVGDTVTNPVTDEDVRVLPATFVDPDSGTGIVMSVPAHSPDDFVALQELAAVPERLEGYPIDPDEVAAIEPTPILELEDYGEIPAKDLVRDREITSSDDPALEEATADLYAHEFHEGQLLPMYGDDGGKVIEDVRDGLKARYREQDVIDVMYDFPDPVVSRAGGKVVVAYQDTWFLRYNDAEWRAEAHRAVDRLDAIPENTREQYDDTIEWLNEWPCIRNYGLGTRLPWDDEFVIEPLSDSTIYMSYYTIAHRLDEIPVEALDRDFFDALFLGPEAVEVPDERALELREEWSYWYPVDVRCSANDLVRNHLTFFLYHHAELFAEEYWPQAITVMGMGLLEGEKMSSSKGHVVLPGEAIERYGADAVRFFLMNAAEPWQDYDWRGDEVSSVRGQLDRFWNRATELIATDVPARRPTLSRADQWILAKLQETVREVTAALDRFETRTASQHAFYRFDEHLRWYRRRTEPAAASRRWTEREILRTRLQLLAPFTPFLANELHEQMTGEPAEDVPWPDPDPDLEDETIVVEEELVRRTHEDVRDIVDVTGRDPEVLRLYTAADWKVTVLDAVITHGNDQGAIMGALMSEEDMRERGNDVNQLVGTLIEDVRGLNETERERLADVDEHAVLNQAADFFARSFDATVEVYREDEPDVVDPEDARSDAIPSRPAIHIA